jgi:hypothetical protein
MRPEQIEGQNRQINNESTIKDRQIDRDRLCSLAGRWIPGVEQIAPRMT